MNFKSQWQYYKAAKAQIVLTNAVTGLCQSIHCITWRLVPPVRCKIPIQSTNMESPGLELQRICLHGLRFLQLLLKARNEDNKKDFFPWIYLNSHLSWLTSQSLIGLLLVQGAALSFFWLLFFWYERNFMQCDWIGPNKNSSPFWIHQRDRLPTTSVGGTSPCARFRRPSPLRSPAMTSLPVFRKNWFTPPEALWRNPRSITGNEWKWYYQDLVVVSASLAKPSFELWKKCWIGTLETSAPFYPPFWANFKCSRSVARFSRAMSSPCSAALSHNCSHLTKSCCTKSPPQSKNWKTNRQIRSNGSHHLKDISLILQWI